ncbi:MAG TPA: thiamine pyrophosphate-binding protein [Caulobacteraceae bacterium]|jgi:thiamine pyrophosphate-dependent acetolactate synthase large subunit-like protein
MSKDDDARRLVGRRGFLKGAATTGAASMAVGVPALAEAQAQGGAKASAGGGKPAPVPAPNAAGLAREAGANPPLPAGQTKRVTRPGSDLMVETLKRMGVEFVTSNNGSSFEGLQESIVNYGSPPNTMPEFITCLHEESAVDMGTGYAKATGKPLVALLHGTLGLQHASMAIYQAYYGGIPMIILAGRDKGFIQAHTADDMASMVRGFTKWDAQPKTLPEALDVLQEAYRQATTVPTGPVVVIVDTELQKEEAGSLQVPPFRPAVNKGVDADTAAKLAERLLAAKNPRLAVGHLRTPAGVKQVIELAELLGASTSTEATAGPMSFPNRHPLCGPGASTDYDFTLGLETKEADVAIVGPAIGTTVATRDKGGIGFGGLVPNPNVPERGRRPAKTASEIHSADAEASLPLLIAAVQKGLSAAQKKAAADRAAAHAPANRTAAAAVIDKAFAAKKDGWDQSPVSLFRIYAELWPLLENEDWCLASPTAFSGGHHAALWAHNEPYSYLGPQPAGGIGYGCGASGGAGLAARGKGRFVVNIQTDGDMNYTPGVLWTEAHHRLPVLSIMHNNRAWHQELMFLEFMAGARGRGTDRASIGSTLRDPFIQYAKMAEAYGVKGEGPIEDPKLLTAAFKRGIAAVKSGQPYMIDVVTQPR